MKDDLLHDAINDWEVLSGTREQMLAYEGRMKRIIDEEAAVREAELRVEEARQEARQEARREAELRIQEAREKGRQEVEIEIVRNLLVKNMNIKMIAEITGFTEVKIEEIIELVNKH